MQPISSNTRNYVELQKKRAESPEYLMDCVNRLIEISRELDFPVNPLESIADIGCGSGHLFRQLKNAGLASAKYIGLDIDKAMVEAGKKVLGGHSAFDIRVGDFEKEEINFDVSSLVFLNSFMYFTNVEKVIKKLANLGVPLTIVRGYFCENSYRIIRSQDSSNHDQAKLDPVSNLRGDGSYQSFDYWNIYSFELIEKLVIANSNTAKVAWFDDVQTSNTDRTLSDDSKLGVPKRGETQIFNGMEISFPFVQPWKFLVIRWK